MPLRRLMSYKYLCSCFLCCRAPSTLGRQTRNPLAHKWFSPACSGSVQLDEPNDALAATARRQDCGKSSEPPPPPAANSDHMRHTADYRPGGRRVQPICSSPWSVLLLPRANAIPHCNEPCAWDQMAASAVLRRCVIRWCGRKRWVPKPFCFGAPSYYWDRWAAARMFIQGVVAPYDRSCHVL